MEKIIGLIDAPFTPFYENGEVFPGEGSNASGILSTMCGCNCLIEIPAGTECVTCGEETEVILL